MSSLAITLDLKLPIVWSPRQIFIIVRQTGIVVAEKCVEVELIILNTMSQTLKDICKIFYIACGT